MARTVCILVGAALCPFAAASPILAQVGDAPAPRAGPPASDGFFFGGGTEAGLGWATVGDDSRSGLGSDFFLAPGLGLQTRWWSGDDPAEEWDIGPVASLAAGTYLDTGSSWVVIPEVFADLSLIELEGDVTTGRAGLRFSFVRVGPS